MKFIKFFGLALIIIGAAILVISYFQGWVNNNAVTGSSLTAMIVGLIIYILAGKKCLEKK